MISDFISTYYVNPIVNDQPFNPVSTITFALILIVSVFLIYHWLVNSRIEVNRDFILATLPFVVLGGLMRVLYSTGMITSPWKLLLTTPQIFFVLFFYTAAVLLVTRTLNERGWLADYLPSYRNTGIVSCITVFSLLIIWGYTHTTIDPGIPLIILVLAVGATVLLEAVLRYLLKWEYVTDPLYITLIFGQMLDASSTSFGIDFHPLGYVEQHIVGSALIEWTGTAFALFPLKIVVIVPAIYLLQIYRNEAPPVFWHLVMLAMIVIGLAPGVMNMVQMMLFV